MAKGSLGQGIKFNRILVSLAQGKGLEVPKGLCCMYLLSLSHLISGVNYMVYSFLLIACSLFLPGQSMEPGVCNL